MHPNTDAKLHPIPVIDLKGGKVVAARLGNRADYRPIESPLCPSPEPATTIAALLELYPFDTLYVADLDAIAGNDGHWPTLAQLHRRHPGLRLWVDNGLQDLHRLAALARPVLGSESLGDPDALADLLHRYPSAILSLDYRGDRLLGPAGLDRRPELWPPDLIVMTLSRVGSDQGPDLDRLAAIRRAAPGCRVYGAGGVRHSADLRRLASLGVAGTLLSTALHQGRLGAEDLAIVGD